MRNAWLGRILGGLFVVSSVGMLATPARACSLAPGPTQHEIDATLAATDKQGPSKPVIRTVTLRQDHDSPPGDSCGDLSFLTIELDPVTDDHSPANKLGYEIEVVSGKLPRALSLPAYAVRPPVEYGDATHPVLSFVFGESNQDVRFSLRVTAVDEAGNRSDASVAVEETGAAGCATTGNAPISGGSIGGALLVWGATLALLRRRKQIRQAA